LLIHLFTITILVYYYSILACEASQFSGFWLWLALELLELQYTAKQIESDDVKGIGEYFSSTCVCSMNILLRHSFAFSLQTITFKLHFFLSDAMLRQRIIKSILRKSECLRITSSSVTKFYSLFGKNFS
jgi:hypothetical protein